MDVNTLVVATSALLSLLIAPSLCFILNNDCHVSPHCDCSRSLSAGGRDITSFVGVFCEDKSLTRVPSFRNVTYRMTKPWTIDLQSNSIWYIPDRAFSNLHAYGNGNNVSIFLGRNNLGLGNSSDSAFSGIESLIIFVGLDRNQLQSIPPFLSKLPNLQGVNIEFNPISYMDPSFFVSHRTMKTLRLSIGDLSAWPQSLNVLAELETLDVETKHISIPANAFTGVNNTLRHLLISNNAGFVETDAVCSLGVLESLEIYIYPNCTYCVTNNLLFNCTMPIKSMKHISIDQSTYDKFPNVFRAFPNLERFYFSKSNIGFIDTSLVPTGVKLKRFACSSCQLTSVPSAINLFRLLEWCALIRNGITNVERLSFDRLQKLWYIELSDNPIIYISRDAFRNLPALSWLGLSRTKLTTIPQAVTTLPGLRLLSIGENITCSCGPHWMKQWAKEMSRKHVSLYGGCRASTETFRHYVEYTLPYCP